MFFKKTHTRHIPKIPRNAFLKGSFSRKVVGYDTTLSADKCSTESHSWRIGAAQI